MHKIAIAGVALALLILPSTALADCGGAVQGRIAWDYDGHTQWNAANVDRLCRGSASTEPARCFEHAMHGGVNWGGGTRWQWGNAIDLCEGSVDAARTISCFETEIAHGSSWTNAIAACDERAPTCENAVQGKIAWDYNGSTQWNPSNVNRLCRGSASVEPARCFEHAMHGGVNWGGSTRWQWGNAIDLCEGSADAARTVRCFQNQIARGQSWQNAIAACDERSVLPWTTQNLNIDVPGSFCYGQNAGNCATAGRLYTLEGAHEACRLLGSEWRLPTDEDWRELTRPHGGAYGDNSVDGGKSAYRGSGERRHGRL